VAGALRRAHAHPNRLVHPHLLAVAYLQSGVSANCRPGDYADANQVEREAWALLRQQCAHLDRSKLTPVRRFVPFGGVRLKVLSTDTMLPVAMCSIHSLLVEEGEEGE